MERKNLNRGFKALRVWNNAIDLYVLICKVLNDFSYEHKKMVSNAMDAAQSISRNIAEGYCRRSIRDYIRFLYFALGSLGELHSCLVSMQQAKQISNKEFEEIDILQYKIENELIKLVKSLQVKIKDNDWNEEFI